MADFNYGSAELSKVEGADTYRVKVRGSNDDGRDGGETHWLRLTPEQYAQVKELIISFNL